MRSFVSFLLFCSITSAMAGQVQFDVKGSGQAAKLHCSDTSCHLQACKEAHDAAFGIAKTQCDLTGGILQVKSLEMSNYKTSTDLFQCDVTASTTCAVNF